MRLVKIEAAENGGHQNQTINRISQIPEGWAVIPDDMETPNFPYGDITVEDIPKTEIDVNEEGEEVEVVVGYIPTVTSWIPREMPEIPEAEAEPTAQDDTDTMLVDHEYRITLLELGV